MRKPKTQSQASLPRIVSPLQMLVKAACGRKIEMHISPEASPAWARASVYVRGGTGDQYGTVAAGHGSTPDMAVRRALRNWSRTNNRIS